MTAPSFTKDEVDAAFFVGVLAGSALAWALRRLKRRVIDVYLARKRRELWESLPPSLRRRGR